MNNSMPASMHKRQDSMISLGGGSTSGDDFFASVAGFEDFGNGDDDLDLMDGEDESKDSLGDLQQDGSGGPAKKLKRPPSTAEKKATHNAVERARRESLNGRFLVLADMLPGMNHVKRASKAAIVNKSIDLINDLRATEVQLKKENSALKQELEALRSRVGSGANNGPTASATGPLTPGMPLPLPAGMQGPAAAHAAAAAAAAMIAAGHHPHTHPALAGLTGQLPPPLAFQQQLQQQMQDGGAGMMSSLTNQQQPPLTPNGPLSAQQMHEHAAAMTMAAHQHQFLQQQHHLAQQQAQAQAQAQVQAQQQQQQQMQVHQQQMQQQMFPGVFNGFFNGVGLLDTLESARSESGSPTSVHSSAQQQAILGTSPSSSHFAYNAAGIPQLPTPAPLANAAAAAAYFNEAALTASSTSPSSSENNNINSNNSLHTLLGNAASANTPPASHYSPISFHSPSSSSAFAQQRLGSRGTASGSSGNEGTAPSPASSHSVPTPPNATYSPPSSTTSAVLKKDSDAVSAAVAAVQPALASPLLPNNFEDANAKAQADLQQYFAYQQRLASLNSAQAAQAQAAAAAAAMGFLPSHAAAALAQAQQQGSGNTSPNSASFGANGQGMNIPAWQLMMAQHQALSTYGGVTGPTHF